MAEGDCHPSNLSFYKSPQENADFILQVLIAPQGIYNVRATSGLVNPHTKILSTFDLIWLCKSAQGYKNESSAHVENDYQNKYYSDYAAYIDIHFCREKE